MACDSCLFVCFCSSEQSWTSVYLLANQICYFHVPFSYVMLCSYSYWKTSRYRVQVKLLLLNPSTVMNTCWYLSHPRIITVFTPFVL